MKSSIGCYDSPAGEAGVARVGGPGDRPPPSTEDAVRKSETAVMERDSDRDEQSLPPTFEALFTQYRALVQYICLKFTGSPEDAEDVTQEVFTKIWKNLEDFQQQSSLRTWIYRIAMNTCIDYSRRPWRRFGPRSASVEDLMDQADPAILGSDEVTAERRLLDAEQARRIRKAITKLKPPLRAVLILKDLEELSYEEISAVLGIGIGTISSRLNRARKALQEALQAPSPASDNGA
jgi:RNA polymerase sigma factor (sigma-70 family)